MSKKKEAVNRVLQEFHSDDIDRLTFTSILVINHTTSVFL
jgi:hypothetical protein